MGNSVYECLSPLACLPAAHSYGRQELKGEVLIWTRMLKHEVYLLTMFGYQLDGEHELVD